MMQRNDSMQRSKKGRWTRDISDGFQARCSLLVDVLDVPVIGIYSAA